MVSVGLLVFAVLTFALEATAGRSGPSSPPFGDPTLEQCRRKANNACQNTTVSTCFGVQLPYGQTSNELVNVNYTQIQIQNELKRWESLRNVPRCWAVIQPLLCSIYMPKCEDDLIFLPPPELCWQIKKPCAIIEKALQGWPEVLRCDDYVKVPPSCEKKYNDLRDLKDKQAFNTSSTCIKPLKLVESGFNYYPGFDGCALNCTNPLYTKEEHDLVHTIIYWIGLASGGCNLFVCLTFIVNWKSRSYPSLPIFYVNGYYLIATLGWMIQFAPNTKDDIVCRKDSTIRRNEPGSGENIFCPAVFTLIYFGTIAALCWLCVFAYAMYLTCNVVGPGRVQERVDKKRLHFNVFSFLIPLVLTFVSLSVGQVEGNSMTGVCFLGLQESHVNRSLIMGPVCVACLICLFFFARGIYRLISILTTPSDFLNDSGRKEVKKYAWRMGIFNGVMVSIVVAFMVFQFQLMKAQPGWEKSLEDNILCRLNLRGTEPEHLECEIQDKSDKTLIIGQAIVFFLGGVLVSTWCWCNDTLKTWKRYLRKRCGSDHNNEEPPKNVKKHQLIQQAFSKRHQIPANGRLSLSLQSTVGDPMGLNKMLDPNHLCKPQDLEMSQQLNTGTDVGSEVNSEWAAALPHLLDRRGALIPPHSSVSCMSEDYSQRRASYDSAVSEVTMGGGQGSGSTHKKSYRKFLSKRFGRASGMRAPWKRGAGGSSTSLESNTGSLQILPAITALINKNQGKSGNGVAPEGDFSQIKRVPRVKEVEVQTSLERFPIAPRPTVDKAIQSSLVSLHDNSTQTKKTIFKSKEKKEKKNRDKKEDKAGDHHTQDKATGKEDDDEEDEDGEDLVSQLLTPIP